MSYRVQKSFVSQKRNPWIILVLVLAVLAFVGFSMIPLLGSVLKGRFTFGGSNTHSNAVNFFATERRPGSSS
jgi:phosphotransferase system  glucose/maltose/N-acetylglucosamine-specific IIC component